MGKLVVDGVFGIFEGTRALERVDLEEAIFMANRVEAMRTLALQG